MGVSSASRRKINAKTGKHSKAGARLQGDVKEPQTLSEDDETIVQILSHLIRSERVPRHLRIFFRQPFMLFALRIQGEMRKDSIGLDQAERVARAWVTSERT